MLNALTREKVKEVVRLAKRARQAPGERPDDPHRGDQGDARGVTAPGTPPEPQPAADWPAAVQTFIADLSDPALDELLALYRLGRGDAQSFAAGLASAQSDRSPHLERVGCIAVRSDLVAALEAGLERI